MMQALGAAVAVLTIVAFIWAMDWLGEDVGRAIEDWPEAPSDRSDALVPELAAARRMPDYRGRCRCDGCRRRPSEPCSDFDE